MSALRPIEIIGGGLAGLSLGLALRRAGAPVTLIDAGHYPRHRVCGDFITGLEEATIDRLGLAPFLSDALHHREVAWFHRAQLIRLQTLPAVAYGLSRYALDARLAAAFVSAGGDLRCNTRATHVEPTPGRVHANGRPRPESPRPPGPLCMFLLSLCHFVTLSLCHFPSPPTTPKSKTPS